MNPQFDVVMVGNPNCGKTSIFNGLCNTNAKVGNFPGCTVEKHSGLFFSQDSSVRITDLPGTYSLNPNSPDEKVACDYLLASQNSLIINVVDGTNLERHLYLTLDLLELGRPMLLMINMWDEMESRGILLDIQKLSSILGIPVYPVIGNKNLNKAQIFKSMMKARENLNPLRSPVLYNALFRSWLSKMTKIVDSHWCEKKRLSSVWVSRKVIEGDEFSHFVMEDLSFEVLDLGQKARDEICEIFEEEPVTMFAEARHEAVVSLLEQVQSRKGEKISRTARLDRILLHRFFGLPIFFFAVYVCFQMAFVLGEYPMQWIDSLFSLLSATIAGLWPSDSDSTLRSLIVDGVINGTGGVIIFLPNIVLLFLGIALFEGTGYMARGAFLLDRAMKGGGLHGKSFLPMASGLGCTVPAIMATRIMENQTDRFITLLVLPLVSCGARMPIYGLLIPVFFAVEYRGLVLFIVYLAGILMAFTVAKVMRKTIFKSQGSSFIMEIPPLRFPTARFLLLQMWERAKIYLSKVGTVILVASMILWLFARYPRVMENEFSLNYATMEEQEFLKAQKEVSLIATGADEFLVLREKKRKLESESLSLSREEFHSRLSPLNEELATLLQKSPRNLHLFLSLWGESGHKKIPGYEQFQSIYSAYQEKISSIRLLKRQEELEKSFMGRIGKVIEPVFTPIGFDWRITTAMIGALAGKEIFVSQLGIVFGMGEVNEDYDALESQSVETGLVKAIRNAKWPEGHHNNSGKPLFNPLVAISLMIFCLISAPCLSTIAVTMRETNSWVWGFWQFAGLSFLAYGTCLILYQGGLLLGFSA